MRCADNPASIFGLIISLSGSHWLLRPVAVMVHETNSSCLTASEGVLTRVKSESLAFIKNFHAPRCHNMQPVLVV